MPRKSQTAKRKIAIISSLAPSSRGSVMSRSVLGVREGYFALIIAECPREFPRCTGPYWVSAQSRSERRVGDPCAASQLGQAPTPHGAFRLELLRLDDDQKAGLANLDSEVDVDVHIQALP